MLNFRRVGHNAAMDLSRLWVKSHGSRPLPLKFALKVTHAPPFEHQHFDQHPLMLIIASP